MKKIVLCNKNTLGTTPVDALAMGLRSNAGFESDSKDTVKTNMDQELRNQINFKLESETFQSTLFMLKKLIDWAGVNFDGQLVTYPDVAGGNSKVFKFAGNNFFGLEFQYEAGVKKRAAKVTLERSMDYDAAKSFIDGASTATEATFAGITNKYGIDYSKYRYPAFLGFQLNGNSYPVALENLQDYKFIIKTDGKKSEINNTPKVNNLSFELEITTDEASIAKIIEVMNAPMCPGAILKLKNPNGYYDAFNFAEGTLSMKNPFKISDDDSLHTIKLQGKVNRYDLQYLFGVANGSSASDTKGETGGTMMIGHS